MKKVLFFFMFCAFVFTPLSVKAACDYNDQSELIELSKHIDYTYDYKDDIYFFDVKLYNVVPELKITYKEKDFLGTNNQVILRNINRDENRISVFGSASSKCPDFHVRDIDLELPIYNVYYESTDCKDYPDFNYCREFLSKEITDEEFNTALAEYIVDKEMSENSLDSESILEEFLTKENIILLSVSFVILIIIIIFVVKTLKLKKL